MAPLLQTVWLVTDVTVATGFTVMVKVLALPAHVTLPLVYEGVTVIVAVTATLVTLVAVKLGMCPTPLAPSPMEVVLFVQL